MGYFKRVATESEEQRIFDDAMRYRFVPGHHERSGYGDPRTVAARMRPRTIGDAYRDLVAKGRIVEDRRSLPKIDVVECEVDEVTISGGVDPSLGDCDCPVCCTIWDKGTGYHDLITPKARLRDLEPWDWKAKLFWALYLGGVAFVIGVLIRVVLGR